MYQPKLGALEVDLPLYSPEQPLDTPTVHDNAPASNQADKPEKGEYQNGNQK